MRKFAFNIKHLHEILESQFQIKITLTQIAEITGYSRRAISKMFNNGGTLHHTIIEDVLSLYINMLQEKSNLSESQAIRIVQEFSFLPQVIDNTKEKIENILLNN